jgi:hypothetical protein
MLHRFVELLPFLDRDDDVITDFLPSASATKRLRALLADLADIESVSKAIQSVTISMWDVRALFDALIEKYPAFAEYLGTCLVLCCCIDIF